MGSVWMGVLLLAAFIFSGIWEQEHVVRRTRPLDGGWCQHCFCSLTVGFGETRSVLGKGFHGPKRKKYVPDT